MDKPLHKHFIATAAAFSPQLAGDIKAAGPLVIPNRKHQGIGDFLSRVIIGQQLSTKAAATIRQRVQTAAKAKHSRVIDFFHEKNVAALRECGVSGNKTKALLAIREAVAEGTLNTRKLNRLSIDERTRALTSIYGVGGWTADMASIFFFSDKDIWPDGDLSVVNVFQRYLNKRQSRTAERYAARFSPHRSYLAYYMWHLADGVPTE
ncbi:MAG: DNA-3-methyladenine glycosylase family protein [Gammaproteobacteria bacterium]